MTRDGVRRTDEARAAVAGGEPRGRLAGAVGARAALAHRVPLVRERGARAALLAAAARAQAARRALGAARRAARTALALRHTRLAQSTRTEYEYERGLELHQCALATRCTILLPTYEYEYV